ADKAAAAGPTAWCRSRLRRGATSSACETGSRGADQASWPAWRASAPAPRGRGPRADAPPTARDRRSRSLAHRERATIFLERRQPAQRTHAIACQQFIELGAMRGKLRAVGFRVPQMQHAGREAPVLSLHASPDHADDDVGIFQTPADERGFKSVDAFEIGAPERE